MRSVVLIAAAPSKWVSDRQPDRGRAEILSSAVVEVPPRIPQA